MCDRRISLGNFARQIFAPPPTPLKEALITGLVFRRSLYVVEP